MKPKIEPVSLTLKPKLPQLKLKVEEKMTETEAEQEGIRELLDGIRVGRGPDWELWIEPLNFVLVLGQRRCYYSSFEGLIKHLANHRIKYWLTQYKWGEVENALIRMEEEQKEFLSRIEKNLDYLANKYGIQQT